MNADPRWLGILKASGPQTLALAAAFGLFWLVDRRGLIPSLPAWIVQLTVFGFLVCACLAIVSFLTVVIRLLYVVLEIFVLWLRNHRTKR
jgi:hypothetical protein